MKTRNIFIALFSILTFSACEKVIYPDLSNGKTLLVIQSRISTDSAPWVVRLTLTQDYFIASKPQPASGAQVIIYDSKGGKDTLSEDSAGYYSTAEFKKCEALVTYTLEVNYQGKKYTAAETCPKQEPIDSLTSEFRKKQGFIAAGYYVTEHAQENPGPGDYYLWEIYRNDTLINDFGYFLNDDAFVEGNYISASFPFPFELNDTVRVDQLSITKQWYNYLIAVQSESAKSGSPFDTPPANPINNIEGEALGYFAVVNLQRKGIRIR